MSNPTIRCKLISGSDELNIHDWSNYVLTGNGLTDAGQTLELRWQTPLGPCEGGTGNLQRLVGELRKYIQRAKQYEEENIGNPVYLAVYWPECEDIPIPCFGRGWRYKRITDGALSEATPGLGQGQPDMRFGSDVIPVLAAMFAVKQDPDGEYAWRSDFRWAAQCKGHIEPVPENGIRMWEASQNLLDNGDFELDINDWVNTNLTDAISTEKAKYGRGSYLLIPTAIAGSTYTAFTGAAATEYTASAWFYVPCGVLCSLWQLQLYDDVTGNIVTAAPTLNDTWERVTITGTTNGGAAVFRVYVATTSVLVSEFIWVDGVQVEALAYATPFIQPDRHLGETWDTCGSHYNSDSSRANGECRIILPLERSYATPCCGSIHFWWQPEFDSTDITGAGEASLWDWYHDADEYIWVYYDYSTQTVEMRINNAMTVTSVAQVFSAGDFIAVGASWSTADDVYKLYIDGALVDTDTTALVCPALRGDDIFVGSEYNASDPMNGAMYDLRHWTEVLVDVHMKAVYNAGRGNGELPYIWSEKGFYETTVPYGGEMENHDDGEAGDTNYVEAGNVAGDTDAPGYFLMHGENMSGSPVLTKFYYGVRRIEASSIPVDGRCGQFIWEGEFGAGAGWANDASDAVHTSGGLAKRVTAPAAFPATGWTAAVTLYGPMYYMLRGQWRIWGRMRTDDVSDVYIRVRLVDGWGGVLGFSSVWLPDDTGLQLDVDSLLGSTGHWELHDFGVVNIPLWQFPEKQLLKGGSDNYSGAQPSYIEVQVMGIDGTEIFDLDYLMLMPEEMTGSWLTKEGAEDSGATSFVTDTESARAGGMYQGVGRGTEGGVTFGLPVEFRGDPVWFLANDSSRILCAICEEHTNVVITYNAHVIARAIYADAKLAHRYYRSR